MVRLLRSVNLVKVSAWGTASMFTFAFVTTLWSAIRAPAHVTVTGADVIFSTLGWTIHLIIITSVVWAPLFIVVMVFQLKED